MDKGIRSDVLIQTRDQLVEIINHLGLKRGAEIGVCRGEFSEHLLSNSGLDVLYSIDAWTEDEDQTFSVFKKCDLSGGKQAQRFDETRDRLAKFGDRSKIIRKLSFEAVEDFEDASLDFVYLDASHRFSGFAMDMIQWWPKVRWGGVYSGHDYWRKYRYETCYVVNGFCVEMKQFFYLTTHEKWNFPASWYLFKKDRSKSEYFSNVAAHQALLDGQAKSIMTRQKREVDLPYEYTSIH